MSKYYFIVGRDPERGCMSMDNILDRMRFEGLSKLKVNPAIMDTKSDYFYCSELNEPGVVGEGCGKECESYAPRNGKNGRCRFSKNLYVPSETTLTVTLEE